MALRAPYSPVELSDGEMAFPVRVVDRLMPSRADIPKEFQFDSDNFWNKIQMKWFFEGFDARVLKAKDGIDRKIALRHLRAIQESYEPQHEHKEEAVAWLMSLWFDLMEPMEA